MDVHKIYEADNYIDAQIARGWLESAGISVLVSGEHLGGAIGELPAFGLHSLWVADCEIEAATELIVELRQQRAEAVDCIDEAMGESGPDAGEAGPACFEA